MRYTNPNCYVQYINKTGRIKVKELERQVEASEIIYNLSGIDEDFFLLSLFDNNQRVLGLTFGNVQNLDMISFLNSDFQSVDALPEIAFLTANQYVSIVKDTTNYDINFQVIPPVTKLYTNEELFLKQHYDNSDMLFYANLPRVGAVLTPFSYVIKDAADLFIFDDTALQIPENLFYCKVFSQVDVRFLNQLSLHTPDQINTFLAKNDWVLFTKLARFVGDVPLVYPIYFSGYKYSWSIIDR
ncbi:hypothetical protein [Flavobacterium sp.]|uniref:hypothetical protein n=1 Tax=Flavobacterium sp. TaxID=239 RepID=UPI00286E081D|nr:hypothetical protein [Flavobacterium sp.]